MPEVIEAATLFAKTKCLEKFDYYRVYTGSVLCREILWRNSDAATSGA